MLSIQAKFQTEAIRKRMIAAMEQHVQKCIEAYKKAGIDFVDTARKNKQFGNITHDLVSSMGCVLVVNHNIVFSYFPTLGGGDNGSKQGLAYAREIALLVDDGGIILVCVAGMEYAAAVESKGKDVITGTELRAQEILRKHLKSVKR